MEETKELQLRLSKEFNRDLDDIFQHGVHTFGIRQAEKYENDYSKCWQRLYAKC